MSYGKPEYWKIVAAEYGVTKPWRPPRGSSPGSKGTRPSRSRSRSSQRQPKSDSRPPDTARELYRKTKPARKAPLQDPDATSTDVSDSEESSHPSEEDSSQHSSGIYSTGSIRRHASHTPSDVSELPKNPETQKRKRSASLDGGS